MANSTKETYIKNVMKYYGYTREEAKRYIEKQSNELNNKQ